MKNRHILLLVLLLLAATITVLAAGTKITLDSSKPIQPQIDDFKEWYDTLSFLDKAQWDLAFSDITNPTHIASFSSSVPVESPAYVLPKGKVYHIDTSCQYVRSKTNVEVISLAQAMKEYGPCSRCAD